jgi:AraC-like DNA-binding protein
MQPYLLASHKPPLHRFPVCDSSSVDSWSAGTLPVFGPSAVEPKRGSKAFRARLNLCRLQKMALCYGSFEGAFSVGIPESSTFAQGLPIRGTGQHVNNGMVIPDSPRKGALGAPGPLSLSYAEDFEALAVFMKPDALSDTLSGLIGTPLSNRLELDKSNYDWRPEAPMIRALVGPMISELDRDDTNVSPLVLAELEQAILVAFLCGTGHNYSRLLDGRPRKVAPAQVRLVEEYIAAHWNQPVSIEGLAVAANASARSVFHTFKAFRGYSPMNFLKQERLRHAREMLSKPASHESVTNVTFACGFGNMGRFAHEYQKVFGEMPSETLNRARGLAHDHDTASLYRS